MIERVTSVGRPAECPPATRRCSQMGRSGIGRDRLCHHEQGIEGTAGRCRAFVATDSCLNSPEQRTVRQSRQAVPTASASAGKDSRDNQVASKQRGPLAVGRALAGGDERPVKVRQAEIARSAPAGWRLGLLSLGFAAFGAVLILLEDDATPLSRVYTNTPEFKVWAALAVGLIAALPAVWRVGVDLLSRLGRDPRRVLRSEAAPALIGIVLVVTAAVLAGEYARSAGSPYYGGIVRIGVIYVLAVTAAVPAFMAMWECYRQLAHDGGAGGQDGAAAVNQLLLLSLPFNLCCPA
jgi:hypothetical protein